MNARELLGVVSCLSEQLTPAIREVVDCPERRSALLEVALRAAGELGPEAVVQLLRAPEGGAQVLLVVSAPVAAVEIEDARERFEVVLWRDTSVGLPWLAVRFDSRSA